MSPHFTGEILSKSLRKYRVWLCSAQLVSLLFRVAGRADAGYIKIKAKLSPVELNWGLAELVNIVLCVVWSVASSYRRSFCNAGNVSDKVFYIT